MTHKQLVQQVVDALYVAVKNSDIELIEVLSKAYQRLVTAQ